MFRGAKVSQFKETKINNFSSREEDRFEEERANLSGRNKFPINKPQKKSNIKLHFAFPLIVTFTKFVSAVNAIATSINQ